MANIINGTDTGSGGLITTGDSSDELQLQTAETARVTLTNTAVVVNEDGNDVDFRVEGDADANLLFVDASADAVGIGTNAPSPVGSRKTLNVSGSAGSAIRLSDDTANAFLDYTDGSGARLSVNAAEPLLLQTNSLERMRIDGSSGNVGIGTSSPQQRLDVSGQIAQTSSGAFTRFQNRASGVSVSTSAVDISGAFPGSGGGLFLVWGGSGANTFLDIVIIGDSMNPSVLHSITTGGSPAARTYGKSSSSTTLAMASGTYTVRTHLFRSI